MEENDFPASEVAITHLGDHDFRVEADGISKSVNLAGYFTVRQLFCIHLTHLAYSLLDVVS